MSFFSRLWEQFLFKGMIFVIIPWIILAVVFGIFDLEISNGIVNFGNILGTFGANFGDSPGYALIAIAVTSLIGGAIKNRHKQKIPGYIIIALSLGGLITGIVLAEKKVIIITAVLIVALAIFIPVTYKYNYKEFRQFSLLVVLLAIMNPLIFVQITKLVCGRVRFRDLVGTDFADYTPWYLPPGPSLHNASFPSGHTAMGWMLLPLIILVRDRRKRDPIKRLVIFGSIAWGFFVAVSRVIIGAHFASDVLFSTAIGIICLIFLYDWIYLKGIIRRARQKDPVETIAQDN
ncbi:MAG: phosphatase PAP2 family protein [Candidatus Heimdallarchaeota archaeon]